MKRVLLTCLVLLGITAAQAQTVYYWVGATGASNSNINTASNWNTSINGGGTTRASSTGATDILVFDGSNLGGSTPNTGQDSVNLNASITCGQIKFVNGANIVFNRPTSGTSTITVSGGAGEDFVIESGCTVLLGNSTGSMVFAITGTGRCSGAFGMITPLQARIANGTAGTPGSFIFTAGSKFTTNITAASAAYPFGNSSQSSEQWVVFEAGAHLYYEGGYSPMASSSTFMPVDFRPGSFIHFKASNPATGFGVFFNRKSFANVVVENGATVTADGPVNRIDTLQITPGSTFITHSSGQTVVLGNIEANGSLQAPAASTNELLLAGTVPQTVSGIGSISVPSLIVADGADVTLQQDITVSNNASVWGRLNFGTATLNGAGGFTARAPLAAFNGTATTTAGSYILKGATAITGLQRGMTISGPGIAAGSRVASVTGSGDSVYLTQPMTATATGTTLIFSGAGAHLLSANPGGFGAGGSVSLTGNLVYQDGIDYTINAATPAPFGMSSAATAPAGIHNITFNATATTNNSATVSGMLALNAPVTIRGGDVLELGAGATLGGSPGATNYFITATNGAGAQGVLRRNALTTATMFPVGVPGNYLPVMITPAAVSDFSVSTFTGITNNGLPTGTPLTLQERQTLVDAVWNIARNNGSGNADLQFRWTPALEGSAFASFADSSIGIITNNGTTWSAPYATGDNVNNVIDTTYSTFGAFSIGARPPANPFLFNPIAPKTYGSADFTAGVLTQNTATPVQYSSSNPAVATISSSGQIHITGVGSTIIRATQTSDGFYPAADVTQTLVVNKTPLSIKADDITRPLGDPNPTLTVTYTGFVNGESQAVLTAQPLATTTATTASPVGTYPITVSGAGATNYDITYIPGTLTVSPRAAQAITFNALPAKTYGDADFATGITSDNNSIPVVLTSSNPAVATINTNGQIHIVGAGTATITATQAGNQFFFPATAVSQTLTVAKANLTFRAFDTTRMVGDPNPVLRTTVTGFKRNETLANLTTAPTVTTTATQSSAPGYYPITFTPGVSNNYNFIYTNARITVLPATGTSEDNLQAYMIGSGTLRVRVFSTESDLGYVLVYNLSGQEVARRNVFIPQNGFATAEITVSGMAPGMYFVRVVGANTDIKRKALIIH
ncbi:T9SS type A sorting domain-containing protein [Flaviaesturariibacter flavus]|uniref:T9SS type A sorting domain-containing protein n=1 Tax=Flaviaesturariibacter flavus TaxID=2502780 RepID=A0A4R1BK66_9BACT|nr:MBG domain-containing protein [Flaviaesturariibacter flavus]TCJ17696.1 T9SS type A sorting domain-containing protein [Flaviaesturariibacter flavus]